MAIVASAAVTAAVVLPANAATEYDLKPASDPFSYPTPGSPDAVKVKALRDVSVASVAVWDTPDSSSSSLEVRVFASPGDWVTATPLASAVAPAQGSGWQNVSFATPLRLTGGETYEVWFRPTDSFDAFELFTFDPATDVFSVDDTFQVLDGGGPYRNTGVFSWANPYLPHIKLIPGGDSTPPTVTITADAEAGPNGWYDAAQTGGNGLDVTAHAVDTESGVDATDCVLDDTASSASGDTLMVKVPDGHHTVSCTATDKAGNTTSPSVTATYDVDQTAPTLHPQVVPSEVPLLGSAEATPGATDQDQGSGIASASCDPVDTNEVGPYSVGCTATDNAGNVATSSASYLVVYGATWFDPKTAVGAGSKVHVKFSLNGFHGMDVVSAATTCGDGTVDGRLKYDPHHDRYVYEWKTDKAWRRTSCDLTLTLKDTTSHSLTFQFG